MSDRADALVAALEPCDCWNCVVAKNPRLCVKQVRGKEAELVIERTHGVSYYRWLDALTMRPDWDKHNSLDWGYCIFRADAETRCRAMLAAVREAGGAR